MLAVVHDSSNKKTRAQKWRMHTHTRTANYDDIVGKIHVRTHSAWFLLCYTSTQQQKTHKHTHQHECTHTRKHAHCKRATNYRAHLWKITCKDRATYEQVVMILLREIYVCTRKLCLIFALVHTYMTARKPKKTHIRIHTHTHTRTKAHSNLWC